MTETSQQHGAIAMDNAQHHTEGPSTSRVETQYAEPQILLVLIGLPGSGKTTFAGALVGHTSGDHDPRNEMLEGSPSRHRRWLRASQDDAPSRRRQECEARVRNGLRQGYNVIVDRVGFDAKQRSHFVNIADAHQPRPKVYALYLEVSVPTLEARLGLRTSHPTLADPETAMRVLADMKRQLSIPRPVDGEGFDRIYTLPESLQPLTGQWAGEDCQSVLNSVEKEGELETVPRKVLESRQPPRYHARGGGPEHQYRGGYRGRGDYRGRGNGYAYRGNGGHPNSSGSYGAAGRSWRPPPSVPYRQPQPTSGPYLNTDLRHDHYQPHAAPSASASFQPGETSKYGATTTTTTISQPHP